MTYLPVDVLIDQKTKERHRIDTLNLLCYVSLLVLVLITTWFFKRCPNNKCHLHETGLAIMYGLIMGSCLRYFGLEVTISSINIKETMPRTAPVDYVKILSANIADKNVSQTHVYAYEFRGEIEQNAELGTQISYASVDPELFFNIILPPIVLNAGLSLKRRHFFRNIGAIFSYAFLGTTVSVASVGAILYGFVQAYKHVTHDSYLADNFTLANCLYFGAIISPTDPIAVLAIFQELGVDVNLFALVFGESILNDAVSIVLTHSIDQFSVLYGHDPLYSILYVVSQCIYNFFKMFLSSCAIGIAFGIITAITTKFTKLTESPLLESSLIVLMSYSAFLAAEVLDSSGIVAILMCGITQAHYTINNLSFEARDRLKTLFELLTFLCENFLFLAVGVCFWQRGQIWNVPFIGMAFIAILVARAISVYPLTKLLNLGRKKKIPMNYQHLIAWGGGARGVISYSLASINTVGNARRIMLSTTSVVVIVTVIAVGGAITPMLKCLSIPYGSDAKKQRRQQRDKPELEEWSQHDDYDDDNSYMATNNPAWLVRPKRVHSARCHHHIHPVQTANDSLLVVGGESLAGSVSTICCPRNKIHISHRRSTANYHDQARCCHPPAETTPVLHSATVPTNRCRGCEGRIFDSRTNSYSSTAQEAQLLSPAIRGRLSLSVAEEDIDESTASKRQTEFRSEKAAEKTANGDCANILVGRSSDQEVVETNSAATTATVQTTDAQATDGAYENASLVRRWRNIDNHFIKPLLTNSQPTLLETMPPSLRAFACFFTSDEQLMGRGQ